MKKRRSRKRIHPKNMIAGFKEVFKTVVVKKTSLRNLLLTVLVRVCGKNFADPMKLRPGCRTRTYT